MILLMLFAVGMLGMILALHVAVVLTVVICQCIAAVWRGSTT